MTTRGSHRAASADFGVARHRPALRSTACADPRRRIVEGLLFLRDGDPGQQDVML